MLVTPFCIFMWYIYYVLYGGNSNMLELSVARNTCTHNILLGCWCEALAPRGVWCCFAAFFALHGHKLRGGWDETEKQINKWSRNQQTHMALALSFLCKPTWIYNVQWESTTTTRCSLQRSAAPWPERMSQCQKTRMHLCFPTCLK